MCILGALQLLQVFLKQKEESEVELKIELVVVVVVVVGVLQEFGAFK